MTNYTDAKIENTKKVYLDGEEYIRVFYDGSAYFDDVRAENYEAWKDATGNYEGGYDNANHE